MYMGYLEEGDKCPEKNCKGIVDWPETEGCSCHIHPPCSACVDKLLICQDCGWEDDRPDHKEVMVAPGLSIREYAPKPLDNSKIDYRAKMHSSSSMIKEGVYPEGTTAAEVREVVNGTFGGAFIHFGGGKFSFKAYTD